MLQDFNVIDYRQGDDEYGREMVVMMIKEFESTCFDARMEQLLEGMVTKNFVMAMVAAHTMKGSCGYIYAKKFLQACKTYQENIKADCQRIEYDPSEPVLPNRPQYALLPSFDTQKLIKTYELFFPFMVEAKKLKVEMSKYTGSEFPENIYENQVESVKKHYEQLKGQSLRSQNKLNTLESIKQIPSRQETTIEQPKDTKCCDKCQIF